MSRNTSVNLDIIINSDGYSIGGGTILRNFTLTGDDFDLSLSSVAQGHILFHDGNNFINLAPSTSGYFLQTQGLAANVQWAQPSHNDLADLSSDDHSQYMLLAGRAGGQILVGGINSGDDIVFETTSNITKGSYIFSELITNGLIKTTGASGTLDIATADTDYQQVITWGDGLTYAAGTASVDYNTTNLKITASQIDTIQSIAIASTPTFASMILAATTNQLVLGITNTTTISSIAPSSSRIYTIADSGGDANFVMTEGTQTINGTKTLTGDNINSGSVSFTKINAVSSSANAVSLSGTLGIMNGSDIFRGIYLNYINSNHSGTDNYFYGIDIANIIGDADCSEIAIQIGSGWDYGVKIVDSLTASLWLSSDDNDSASGIRFGSTANSVSLYKSANDTLKTDDSFVVGSNLSVSSTTTLDTSLNGLIKTTAGVISAATGDLDYQQVIIWGDGLTYAAGTASIDYNTTNLKITTAQIDTIQSIATAASPAFSSLTLSAATNQLVLGSTNTTTITSTAPAASRVYTIPDSGGTASFVMTESTQIINGDKTLSGSTSLTKVNTAGGSANVLTLSGTLGIMDGSDTFRGIYLNYTNSNHTGITNTFYGIDINSIIADADCTEIAIQVGSGWDYGIKIVDASTSSLWLSSDDNDTASGIKFGSTANSANLYKSANDTLKTDDNFIVGGTYLQISNQSAVPGTTAGMIYTDSDDNTFGWYSGAAWHYAFGTNTAPMTYWVLSGSAGANQTIMEGETASFVGALGITTTGVATDILQIDIDTAETFTSTNAWTGIHEFKNDVKVIATDADADIEFQLSDAQYDGGTTHYWSIGIDDNSSDSFKISASNTLGTNDAIIIENNLNVIATTSLVIGVGAVGIDYVLTFNGETNDGTLTFMEDENRFDFSSPIKTTNITDSGLTITRIPYASTGGLLVDSASMVFDTTNGMKLAAGSSSALNLTSTAGTAVGGLLLGTDTNLYRSAANMLKTDDSLTIAGGNLTFSIDTDINVLGGASGLRIVNGTDIITMLPNIALVWSMLQSDLSTSAGAKGINFGAANSTNNSGVIRYVHNGAAAATSYMGFGFYANDDILSITVAKNVILGTQAALATNATAGFAYIPTCAGTPTGVPTAYTGKVAMIYDTTNNEFYIYNGGWKSGAAFS